MALRGLINHKAKGLDGCLNQAGIINIATATLIWRLEWSICDCFLAAFCSFYFL